MVFMFRVTAPEKSHVAETKLSLVINVVQNDLKFKSRCDIALRFAAKPRLSLW